MANRFENENQTTAGDSTQPGGRQHHQGNSNLYESGYPGAPGRSNQTSEQSQGSTVYEGNGNGQGNGQGNDYEQGNGQRPRRHGHGHGHGHGHANDQSSTSLDTTLTYPGNPTAGYANGSFGVNYAPGNGNFDATNANYAPGNGNFDATNANYAPGNGNFDATNVNYTPSNGSNFDSSVANGGSNNNGADLANQGLALLQQGDQFDGIMDLLGAEHQSPSTVNNQAFLTQLQTVEANPSTTAGNGATDVANLGTSAAVGTTDATNTITSSGQPDATAMAQKGLTDAQQDPTTGMLELMAASTMNPNLVSDQNFLQILQQALPGAQAQQTDSQGNPIQPQQTDSQGNAIQAQQTDSQGNPIQPTDTSGTPVQTVAQNNYTLPTQLSDTTNNPQSADPSIQQALQQAFTMISQGDQADAALLLMQVAKVDPQILQDQVFVQNLQSAEQAGTSGQQTAQVADQSQQPTDLSATQYQTAANSYAGSNQLQAQTDAPAYQPNPTQQTQPLATGAAAGVAV